MAKKGYLVFVKSTAFPEERPAIVVGPENDSDCVDVFILGTPHYHVDTNIKHREDGEDYGFTYPGEPEPKSAAQVAQEQADADAPEEQLEGSDPQPDSEGDGSELVPDSEEAPEESESDGEGESEEEPGEVDDPDESEEETDEPEADEASEKDDEDSDAGKTVDAPKARKSSRRKR